jgi:hypothetical protein
VALLSEQVPQKHEITSALSHLFANVDGEWIPCVIDWDDTNASQPCLRLRGGRCASFPYAARSLCLIDQHLQSASAIPDRTSFADKPTTEAYY